MKQKPNSRRRRNSTKSILRLPDLEHAKAAMLNSLNSADAKRGYRHAIDEFVDWYCSESRLAFNRIVVLRYRSDLESRQLARGTINLRLGAVRRLRGLIQVARECTKATHGRLVTINRNSNVDLFGSDIHASSIWLKCHQHSTALAFAFTFLRHSTPP
jgi:hypothetical protein